MIQLCYCEEKSVAGHLGFKGQRQYTSLHVLPLNSKIAEKDLEIFFYHLNVFV